MEGHQLNIVMADKVYQAIREETAKHGENETGGILVGHYEEGCFIITEHIEPGVKSIHSPSYFEYDHDYVNARLAEIVKKYKHPPQVQGLWHRHPGSIDVFSRTDDGTNRDFAKVVNHGKTGAISGLVNCDNQEGFRLTFYHVITFRNRPAYSNKLLIDREVFVGDDLIRPEYLECREKESERISEEK